MHIYTMTQKGIGKVENEDRIIVDKTILSSGIFQVDKECKFIAIADGVGGNNAGAVASHYVANRIGDMQECTKELFVSINHDLIDISNKSKHLNKMATTLSGVFLCKSSAVCFHIGNTRVYSMQNGKYLKQLTEDDTTLNHVLKTGQLSIEDVNEFTNKNEITACFGAGNEALFDIKIFNINPSSSKMLLLTSDGIHEYIGTDELESILSELDDGATICNKIIEKSLSNGSIDDLSVVLIYND